MMRLSIDRRVRMIVKMIWQMLWFVDNQHHYRKRERISYSTGSDDQHTSIQQVAEARFSTTNGDTYITCATLQRTDESLPKCWQVLNHINKEIKRSKCECKVTNTVFRENIWMLCIVFDFLFQCKEQCWWLEMFTVATNNLKKIWSLGQYRKLISKEPKARYLTKDVYHHRRGRVKIPFIQRGFEKFKPVNHPSKAQRRDANGRPTEYKMTTIS